MGRPFVLFSWFVVAYNLIVIIWGAFVRATGSGAGCGQHWPLCNGQVIPRPEQIETVIELTHRVTSMLDGFLVIGLVVWALRLYPRGHLARRGAVASLGFVILEGILGAGLVLLELVADNSSSARAAAMAIHLVNTLLLLGVLTLTAWWAGGGAGLRLRGQGPVGWLIGVGVAGMLVVGAAGAVTALGDTLFPARSLAEGIAQDFDPTVHFLIRLRFWHPALAILLGLYLVVAGQAITRLRPGQATSRAAAVLLLLFIAQIAVGTLNVVLLVPVGMQLIHLLMADLVWIALVLLAASALGAPLPERAAQPAFAAAD